MRSKNRFNHPTRKSPRLKGSDYARDRIIRSEGELIALRQYVLANPAHGPGDALYRAET
jgi:hypothetical protein